MMNTMPRTPFIAPNAKAPSKEELARRKRKYYRLLSIGVDPTLLVDEESERENPYIIEAMVLINEDKDVPPELLEKINRFNQENKTNRTGIHS
ncbi:MAG: hypothetical protein J5819_09115 [Eubacterium sp.]|nr:hypothetical protein [Eubacterium sp.]